ncbi:amino acid ABC transporter ATP-binding protein [Leeia sp.]|uniref:amino acid ABC transporter ATP-binding protein n=1 Tax=Leeia sp. TaxID=2884678 RepID=UPI0035B0FCC8
MISLQHLNKSFGSLQVLHDINLNVPEGQVTALIGPSGSGKSTLLRCVNLLELPQDGTLQLAEQRLEFQPKRPPAQSAILALRRRTGMVFQNFQLFPHLNALDNVVEGLRTVHRWARSKAEQHGLALLDKVGLAHKAKAWPHELSGGQQQRVAIARALASSPQVLLCDEPTSALDPELAGEVVEVLQTLAAEGTTMLIATHDLRLAAHIAHQVVFMEAGRIVEHGAAQALFTQPQQARTRDYVSTLFHGLPEHWQA